MKLASVLAVLVAYNLMDYVHCQMPQIPVPPVPQVPMLHNVKVRRSAHDPATTPPQPSIALEQRNRRSAQFPDPPPMPPLPIPLEHRVRRSEHSPPATPNLFEQRNRRSAQFPDPPPMPPVPIPLEHRDRRSVSINPITSALKGIDIGEAASQFYGIRNRREARGGRVITTNG